MQKTTIVLAKPVADLYDMHTSVVNEICGDLERCPLSLEKIDTIVPGETALREFAQRINHENEIVIIDFSQHREGDVRIKLLRELIKNPKAKIYAFMRTVFSVDSASERYRMKDALIPILGKNVVLYDEKDEFRNHLVAVITGNKIIEEVAV